MKMTNYIYIEHNPANTEIYYCRLDVWAMRCINWAYKQYTYSSMGSDRKRYKNIITLWVSCGYWKRRLWRL